MNPATSQRATRRQSAVAQQYRTFLLGAAGALYLVTPAELWLLDHFEVWRQFIPFALCVLGLASVAAMYRAPHRISLFAGRAVSLVVAVGSLYGMYAHLSHNWAFEREIQPSASTAKVLWDAFAGSSPLLAPGILTLAAVLAAAATYRHPQLRRKEAGNA